MGIKIRNAIHDDINKFVDGVIFCQKSDYTGLTPEECLNYVSVDSEKNRRILANLRDGECYSVIHEKKMIGFIIINKPDSESFWAIFLIEEFWNKGYDIDMLDFALDELKRTGQEEISLWVFGHHCGVRAVYEKHGFIFDGTRRVAGKFDEIPLVQIRYVLKLC